MKDQPDTTNNDTPKAPAPAETPVAAPPPTQAWTQTPPEAAKVQYVVAQKSLDGIGGWLIFWLFVFASAGIVAIIGFFTLLGKNTGTSAEVQSLIFSPILAIGYLASVVLIALRKRLGIWTSIGTVGVATLSSIISVIIAGDNSSNVSTLIGIIIAQLVFGGLMALYFFSSKRVKATLVNN